MADEDRRTGHDRGRRSGGGRNGCTLGEDGQLLLAARSEEYAERQRRIRYYQEQVAQERPLDVTRIPAPEPEPEPRVEHDGCLEIVEPAGVGALTCHDCGRAWQGSIKWLLVGDVAFCSSCKSRSKCVRMLAALQRRAA